MSERGPDPPAGDPPPRVLAPGTLVDRYVIEQHVGGGGFGSVHRARHAVLGHPVALKILHPEHAGSPDTVARFFQEARAATAVGSPHIVRILDCGTSPEGQPFLAMELYEGQPLDVLVRRGPMPVDRAVGIALQVLDGLGVAHAAGIVHRDLKPANVFITSEEGGDFVKILDFGISKMRTPESVRAATRSGVVMGTPSYMAPEQFRGARDVDCRADLYSASVVLYEMLSGRAPHAGRSYEDLVVRVCTEKPRPLADVAPSVPPLLCGIVDRGLARDQDARWQSAAELAQALRSALGIGAPPVAAVRTAPQPEVAAPPSVTPRPAIVSPGVEAGRRGRSLWPLLAAAGACAALVTVSAILFLTREDASSRERALAPETQSALPAASGAQEPQVGAPVQDAPQAQAPKPQPPKDRTETPVRPPALSAIRPANLPPAPSPRPLPAARPAEPSESVRVERAAGGPTLAPRVVGQLDRERVQQVLSRARARLGGCSSPGRSVRVQVQIHLALGEVRLALPAPDNQGPADVARCVAARIDEAFPPAFEPEGSGIVFVDVTLPPR
ncbi:MAG: protein kinase [Deltaproteobacteria bacterium]|nr:protein kinase [Deltaproteobacteria bacterium]